MKIDLFIKSYHKDFVWLKYCLASIKKFVTGYNELIIIIPQGERHLLDVYDLPDRTFIHEVDEHGNGYLFQQWCKMNADSWCSGDFIAFTDSDCIFLEPVDYQKLIRDGKSEILYTAYFDANGTNQMGDAICWKAATERFLKQPVDFEFMRRNNLIYRRDTLVNLKNWFPRDLKRYILSQGTFSEFNALGAFAFVNEKEKYNFVNTSDWTFVPTPFKQYWSWGGLTPEIENEIKAVLQ